MRKGHLILRFAALAAVVGFGFGMVRLWVLRFEPGDMYQPYSTLRSDPLGARALYEGLDQLPGVTVRRNFKPLKKLADSNVGTLFYLGVDSFWMPDDLEISTTRPAGGADRPDRAIHKFVWNGGRVVISFTPSAGTADLGMLREVFGERYEEDEDNEDLTEEDTDDEDTDDEDADDEDDDVYSFREALGFSVNREDKGSWKALHGVTAKGSAKISSSWPEIEWHGRVYFDALSDDWRVIYRRNGRAVIIERTVGSGSIVLCGDSYFLSNEAMAGTNRNSQLLAWLASNQRIIFDETHLGVVNAEGIASLARDHGLTNLLFVLLVIAGLYIWKSGVSVVPRDPEHVERFGGREISGRSSAAGLHSLLRKCVPTSRILNECLKHWSASYSTLRPKQRDALDKIRKVIAAENKRPTRQQDPVRTYTTICEILAERK
ncbi:MAG: DUF4350 domain-containing protein [Phycisphaerae bacterium]|jgi:hypothetical protein|nr:DUF4350 domain-containing protein [Phycisphaerae bacterium]